MESTTQKLVVRLKLRRGLDAKLYQATHFATMLSLLGESFRDGKEHFTHSRLMQYLERKGTMEYCQPVCLPAKQPTKNPTASLLVGKNAACQTCRRCTACDRLVSTGNCRHAKVVCVCPFPRRMVPWGKAECAQDKEACDRMLGLIALKVANHEMTLEQYHAKHKWITGMMRRCDSKLFAIRQRMLESEGLIDPKRTRAGVGRSMPSLAGAEVIRWTE